MVLSWTPKMDVIRLSETTAKFCQVTRRQTGCRNGNASGSFRGGTWFESLPGYPDRRFSWFISVPPGRFRIVTSIKPRPLPSTSSVIYNSSVILLFYAIWSVY
jgi:hypothetical protein